MRDPPAAASLDSSRGAAAPVLDAVVGLGSNLGDRAETLASAVRGLAGLARLRGVSALYETAALGPPQPDYLNAAVRLCIACSPRALLGELLALEKAHGRERRERWGPRTLDLDILWISDLAVDEPGLIVPHPGLAERRFALLPLLDVAPDAADPRTGVPYAGVLAALGSSAAERRSAPGWPPAWDRSVDTAPP